jgi:hypothetical protein
MEVGRYYQRSGNWLASVNRFRTVVDKYQTTTHTPEALMRLTESYLALGVPDEAVKSAAVLGRNYPAPSGTSAPMRWCAGTCRTRPAKPPERAEGLSPGMLRQLVIRDVVLIDRLTLDFGDGLGVLTGETGAGKSILLDSLGLRWACAPTAASCARAGRARRSRPSSTFPPAIPRSPCSMKRGSSRKRASRSSSAARSRPTAEAAPSSAADRCRRRPCAKRAARWSRSTASTTIAACSIPRATARCSTISAGSTVGAVARHGAVVRSSRRARPAAPQAADADRDREFLDHSIAELAKLEPEEGEEQRWPRSGRG